MEPDHATSISGHQKSYSLEDMELFFNVIWLSHLVHMLKYTIGYL